MMSEFHCNRIKVIVFTAIEENRNPNMVEHLFHILKVVFSASEVHALCYNKDSRNGVEFILPPFILDVQHAH